MRISEIEDFISWQMEGKTGISALYCHQTLRGKDKESDAVAQVWEER